MGVAVGVGVGVGVAVGVGVGVAVGVGVGVAAGVRVRVGVGVGGSASVYATLRLGRFAELGSSLVSNRFDVESWPSLPLTSQPKLVDGLSSHA